MRGDFNPMNIKLTVRLNPHSEQILREHLSRGAYGSAEEVLERALETLEEREDAARAADLAEFDAALDALAEGSENLPDPPDEAFNRESIYRNHD